MAAPLHVVFGAGQVGGTLTRLLLEAGLRVRVARKSAGAVPDGAELLTGDATDTAFCARAVQGAAVVYHCMNPPYDAGIWADLLPRWMDNLIAAAGRAGARLVVLDNVYMLGRPAGRPLSEDTSAAPCSRKGEIRALVAERLFAAHRDGLVRAVCGRASDFYGPAGRLGSLGDWFWPDVLKGKAATLPFDPQALHSWHYIPDVAAGLLQLGLADDGACGRPWMLPCAPAEGLQSLAERVGRQMGQEIRLKRAPGWLLPLLGVFMPVLREIREMGYQWDEPFVVDDARFRARFQVVPTDQETAAAATAAWVLRTYVPR